MKKLQILGLALVAICALGAVMASTGSATIVTLLAKWLFNTAEFTGNLAVESTGELLLEDTNAVLGVKAAVLCSGILHGTVAGANGEDEITELLSLTGTAISLTALSGTALSCATEENCESPKVWAVNLPWPTLLELVEGGSLSPELTVVLILTGATGEPGWYVECTVLGSKIDDECLASVGAFNASNQAGGTVLATFSEKLIEELELSLAICSLKKEATGIVEGTGEIKDTEAGPLSTSWELG